MKFINESKIMITHTSYDNSLFEVAASNKDVGYG
jgi:hypothetical protein